MATIYDLVTAQNIAAYWTEKNQNRQPYLGDQLFPKKREIGTELTWIKGASNQPVALRTSEYDAKAIRRDRQGLESYKTEMPFFKESVYIDEKLRQQLNNVIKSNNEDIVNAITSKIFDDEANLISASDVTLERMRMELLTTGTITLSSNGGSYNYDYGLANDQKYNASTAWSDPKADIIGDIQKIVDAYKAKGVTLTRAVCNSTVAKYFRTNEAIKNAIYVMANGTVNVGTANAIAYLTQETGIRFAVYDNVYVDEDGKTVKYVADDTVVFLPDGDLGNTHMGTTPEESDLQNSNVANVSIVDDGVAVTTSRMSDPVNVETKVSMVALPSFEEADKIAILDTKATV